MLNRIDALDSLIECTRLREIFYDYELKLARVDVLLEDLEQMRALGFRAYGAANGITTIKEVFDDPDSDEPIRAGDEDFGWGGDGRHVGSGEGVR